VMEEGLAITGVVVDADGRPVASLGLELDPVEQDSAPGNTFVQTDERGRFTFGGLSGGSFRVRNASWWDDGRGLVVASSEPVRAGTTELRLVAKRGAKLAGSVVDEKGAPAGGVLVQAVASEGGGARQAQTKPDGRFEIGGLDDAVSYVVTAHADGRPPARATDVRPGTQDLRLTLRPGLTATGRLLDAAGAPKAGAQVWAHRSADGADAYAQTDARGDFTLTGLDDGEYEVSANAPKPDGNWETIPCGKLKGGDTGVELKMTR
jgi:hypothetical protein